MENMVCTKIRSKEPIIIMVAPFPFLSYRFPKNGVRMMVPKGKSMGIRPANFTFTPNLFIIKSAA